MPGGRPPKEIDFRMLEKFVSWGISADDCASFFECSRISLWRAVKKAYGVSFETFKKDRLGKAKVKILSKFWEKIDAGNMTAIIFGLKNYCDFHDNMKFNDAKGFIFQKSRNPNCDE